MVHIKETLDLILKSIIGLNKEVLSFDEACCYCNLSKSKMYKHTSSNNVPYYKPEGKMIFFKKSELDEWLLRNRQSTIEELQEKASIYSITSIKKN